MFLTNIVRQFRRQDDRRSTASGLLRPVAQMRSIVERERSRADRIGIEFAVLKFSVSDASRADDVFELLAQVLRDRLRCTDEIGWLGPRQLGVVLPSTPADGARTVAKDIFRLMGDHPLPHCEIFFYPPLPTEDEDQDQGHRQFEEEREPQLAAALMDSLFLQPTPGWKRTVDVVGASVGLVLLAPIFAAAALAVRLSSPGPVLFVQLRNGLGGKQFRMYKFRTMVVDAERQQEQLSALNEQAGPIFKIRNDPRITRVGRFLRKTSIDELPQLWNVLKGEMSLVGPRPPIQKEVNQYEGWQRRRLEVTPGITCTWQVQGRSLIPFIDWIRMDIRYIQSRSIKTDLRLLLQTIPAVLLRRGAN